MNAGIPGLRTGRTTGRTTGRAASLAAVTTLLIAPALAAQDPAGPLGTPADEADACPCAWDFEPPAPMGLFTMPDRARIGVVLGEPMDVGGRTGIRIEGVAPESPASHAGLREGDILLSLNGEDLGGEPVEALLDRLEDVDAGDTVTLGYSRDGAEQTATVVTERGSRFSYAFGGRAPRVWRVGPSRLQLRDGPDGPDRLERLQRLEGMQRMARIAPDIRVRVREVMRDRLDLIAMNEGLGEYFDVSEGVLVANVGDDTTLGLRAGDVIVTIGGRDVQDPRHARSIIASYRDDESIEFGIVRDGQRTTVTGTRPNR